MAAYTQFGYGGFPSASQLLPPNATQTPEEASASSASAANMNASSLVMTNVPALSPTGGVDCQATGQQPGGVGGTSTGALSPDALSQNSNAATGSSVVAGIGIGSDAATMPGAGSLDSGAAVGTTPTTGGSSCCENGRPIMTDPVSGQTVCSCQYDTARLALSSYSRLPAASVGVYGSPYPSTDQNPYQSIGVDSSAFYSPLSNPYGLKDSAAGSEMGAWTSAGLQPTTGYYSYDPMSAYGYGASYDLAARRKNATRESTATLKAWLNEHKKNPYPTKGEKIMLAIITKMTLTQVSTWFANARRRLKKENKMTWEPKNRTDDDDDALVSDDEKDKDDVDSSKDGHGGSLAKDAAKDEEELIDEEQHKQLGQANILRAGFGYPSAAGYHGGSAGGVGVAGGHPAAAYNPYHHPHHHHHQHPAYYQPQQTVLPTAAAAAAAAAFHAGESGLMGLAGSNKHGGNEHGDPKNQLGRDCGVPIPASKPKIWSLADTVASKTPPPPATPTAAAAAAAACMMPQQQHRHLHPQENLGMGTSQMQQQQQQEQLQQQQQQQQQQQPLPMGSHLFNGAAPYVRAHTTAYGGFLGATTQQLHTTNTNSATYNNNNGHSNNSSNNNSSNINNNTNGTHTPIIPTITNPNQQQSLHSARPSSQSIASQRAMAMGFPEAQPDTPPQTPPNMKVLSGALSLLPATASQIPMTATCRSSSNAPTTTSYNPACNYPMNYSTRLNDYEYPAHMHMNRDEFNSSSSSSGSSSISSSPPHLQRNENMFRPLFKSLTPV